MSQDQVRARRKAKMDEYLDRGVVVFHEDHVSLMWDIDGQSYGFDIGYELFEQMKSTGRAPVVMELLVRDS